MSSNKIIIVLLIAALGFGNLVVGTYSFMALNSLNLSNRISTLSSQLDSIDTSLIKTQALQQQISNTKQSTAEELNSFAEFSEILNVIPIYFIVTGAVILIIAIIAYFILPTKQKLETKPSKHKSQ